MKYFAISQKGRRENNEDCVKVPVNNEAALAILADGMGGHSAGETASRLAVDTAAAVIKKGGGTPEALMRRAVSAANRAVYDYATEHPECRGMGTTMVIAMPFKSRYFVANIGDSRLYHWNGGELKQITRDHSYVEELVRAGLITREQAAVHPRKNVIMKAIGVEKEQEADLFSEEWGPGDVLLLCTDGLYSGVDDDEMARILREESELSQAAERLAENASYGGSTDNISVVLIANEVE